MGGADNFGKDTEINILTILESNGLEDALWCLRVTIQDCEREKRLIACEFAKSVLHIFETKHPNDDRPRKAIEAAKKFANNEISKKEMRSAAYAAAASKSKKDQLFEIFKKYLQD